MKKQWRRFLVIHALLLLTLGAPPRHAEGANAQIFDGARSNAPVARVAVGDRSTKGKAGFLAGSGLIIITLLALGTALALVRSLKR